MIRNWIKTRAASVLCRTRMDKVVGSWSGASGVPLVVGYHRVVEDFAASATNSIPSMLVSRQMLEHHLDWIGQRYRFVDLQELGSRLESGDMGSEPIAAVTFDDGYSDFYDLARPILQKKGVPAALFVVTDLVGTKNVQTHDKLYLLLARRFRRRMKNPKDGFALARVDAMTPYQATRHLFETRSLEKVEEVIRALEAADPIPEESFTPFHCLNWEELNAIQKAGFTIGSHTKTHVLMTRESVERITDEMAGSKDELEQRLGTKIQHIAYPSGEFDTRSVKVAAEAGYKFGFTGCMHRDERYPLLTVPRAILWQDACVDSRRVFSEALLSCQIQRAFDLVAGCRQPHKQAGERAGERV